MKYYKISRSFMAKTILKTPFLFYVLGLMYSEV